MSETVKCCRGPELRLNLGCGQNILDGWRNSDDDIRTVLSTVQTNTVDFILVEHVCEHTTAPEMLRFFDECRRVMRDGATLRICVPEPKISMEMWHLRDLILGHGHQQVLKLHSLTVGLYAAGFVNVVQSDRKECDGHWRVIGIEKDDLESLRVEAIK
jgi:predicted SAM-dependent methyltransferase